MFELSDIEKTEFLIDFVEKEKQRAKLTLEIRADDKRERKEAREQNRKNGHLVTPVT